MLSDFPSSSDGLANAALVGDGLVGDGPATPELQAGLAALRDALNSVLLGKHDVVELVLACLLARGHLLIEDRPGLGKTSLAKGLAAALGGRLARVQCTPDLLPGDITGFNVFNQKTREFDFVSGPVFADVLLCDEINRATPRTQSALLEAMAERQVTVDDVRYPLSEQFFVVATQNPTEQHGTFPLPEAQLDRFAMKLAVGYPTREYEQQMLAAAIAPPAAVRCDPRKTCMTFEGLRLARQAAAATYVSPEIHGYLLDLAQATRTDPRMAPGVSPRGLLVWQRVAQAWAYLSGRDYVSPDDVQHTAPSVLSVRIGGGHADVSSLVAELLRSTPVPGTLEVSGPKPVSRRSRGVVAVMAAILSLAGCGKNGATNYGDKLSDDVRTDSARATYEDHDHDFPEHKPSSFPSGVQDLVRRHHEFCEHSADAASAEKSARFQQLRDIVGWLPSLAADSDLTEAEWTPVKGALERISSVYSEARPYVEGRAAPIPPELLDRAEREFAELQRIAEEHVDDFEITSPRAAQVAAHDHRHGNGHGHDHGSSSEAADDHGHRHGSAVSLHNPKPTVIRD
jgi:MoxR-like ATPase